MTQPLRAYVLLASCLAAAPLQARTGPPAGAEGMSEELVRSVDLGPEIAGLAGRAMRMRLVTIAPGGASSAHSHVDRPGIVYVLSGTITDHRDGKATDYGPGPGWSEDKGITHWVENRGGVPAVELSVDILKAP